MLSEMCFLISSTLVVDIFNTITILDPFTSKYRDILYYDFGNVLVSCAMIV